VARVGRGAVEEIRLGQPRRVFRAMLREIIAADTLPDYLLRGRVPAISCSVTPARRGIEALPGRPLSAARDAGGCARAGCRAADVYALEAEWRAWWVATGRPTLRAPDRAFLGWVKGKAR
jgi:hypothetical protein